MSKTKSKDFYRKKHKLAKLHKKEAYENKKSDSLIEAVIRQLDTPDSFAPPKDNV